MPTFAPIPHAVDLTVKPEVTAFFDDPTNTVTYIARDPASTACAVIDSVMDIDYAAGRISYASADAVIDHIRQNGLTLEWLIETHVHADHLSGAPYIQGKLGGKIGIGEKITVVQDTFGKVFNEGTEFQRDGSQFDGLFKDGDTYQIGTLHAFAMHTPGHTPACMTHVIGDAARDRTGREDAQRKQARLRRAGSSTGGAFDLNGMLDLFATKPDRLGLADAGQDRHVVKLVDRMLEPQPFHRATGVDVDDQQPGTWGGVFRRQHRVQLQPLESLVAAGPRQADHGIAADKGQTAGIAGANGDRGYRAVFRVDHAQFAPA